MDRRGRIAATQDGARPGTRPYWRIPVSGLARCADAEAAARAETAAELTLTRAAAAAHRAPDFVRRLLESGAITGRLTPGDPSGTWRIPPGEAARIPAGFPRPNRMRKAA